MGCARPGYPGVYTNVAFNWRWIQEKICTLSQRPPKRCRKLGFGDHRRSDSDVDRDYDDHGRYNGHRSSGGGLRGSQSNSTAEPSLEPTSSYGNDTAADATETAICEDTDMLFDVMGTDIQNKDCSWLAAGSNRFQIAYGDDGEEIDDLCEYFHIAYRCPSTCEACDVEFP